jgi:2-oxoglutarate dehydrogenase E2 component (dihydrolipoamide succinyltransferase)
MSVNIVVPPLGESVTEATVAKWHKKAGDAIKMDEILVELETDKVTLEVNAPATGVLSEVVVTEGGSVVVGAVLGHVEASAQGAQAAKSAVAIPPAPVVAAQNVSHETFLQASPAARKIAADKGLDIVNIAGTGKEGRVMKQDVVGHGATATPIVEARTESVSREERVKMTKLRKTIGERLKQSQNTAAILSTFNEVDMSEVFRIRKVYQEEFVQKHGVKLGFMSFFAKAVVKALQSIPAVNAEIDGDYIVYKNHYDLGVAVGTDQGLVVPVLRDADSLSFAEIEQNIAALGRKAREGKLSMADMSGATFTITNGGTYGSLLSTPIINPPQSGILGMHNIVERPMAVGGQVEIRPMMYIALSYDHRIIDGKEAVTFLVKVKQLIENPEKLLFDL